MRIEIQNFYWVMKAFDDPLTPAWQIQVGKTAENMEEIQAQGGQLTVIQTCNMAQAAELGVTLDVISAVINESSLAECDMLRQQMHVLQNPPLDTGESA
jgi:hypothetical protein